MKNDKMKNQYRVNEQIRVREVRVVSEGGSTVMATRSALEMAREQGVDLVEISPNAQPPVCRLIDYSKFLYQQKKHAKEMKAKQAKVEIKEIRFGPQTDEHDYNFKLKHAQEFLSEGNKVRAYVFFRGRSILFKEQGEVLLLRFANDLEEYAKVEQLPKLDGKKMFLYLAPKKAGVVKKSQQKMDREKREAEARSAKETENGVEEMPMTLQELPTDIRGQWKTEGSLIKQTSNEESCIRLNPGEITSNGYIYKVRAKKDAGNEGFLIIFNYVDKNNYCWLNLGGWNNTQHGVESIVNGAKSQIATCPGKIETGKWYDIELKVVGDSIFAKLDGKEVFSTKLKANTLPGIFSTATLDEQTGEVILKIANTSTEHTTAKINLQGKEIKNGKLIRLSAKNGLEENTIDNPTNIYPVENYVTTEKNGATVEIPASSLNIIRLK